MWLDQAWRWIPSCPKNEPACSLLLELHFHLLKKGRQFGDFLANRIGIARFGSAFDLGTDIGNRCETVSCARTFHVVSQRAGQVEIARVECLQDFLRILANIGEKNGDDVGKGTINDNSGLVFSHDGIARASRSGDSRGVAGAAFLYVAGDGGEERGLAN